MYSHVADELVRSRESLSTDSAQAWFFAGVCSTMTLQIRRTWETLIANVAFVRPLAGMSPQMNYQVGRVGKCPATIHTKLVLLLGDIFLHFFLVNLHMRPKVVLPVELLMALAAFEFLLRRDVDLNVPLEVLQPLETLAANLTYVLLFLLASRFSFDPQWSGGFVLDFGMFVQTGLPHEFFITEGAQEFLLLILTLLLHMA